MNELVRPRRLAPGRAGRRRRPQRAGARGTAPGGPRRTARLGSRPGRRPPCPGPAPRVRLPRRHGRRPRRRLPERLVRPHRGRRAVRPRRYGVQRMIDLLDWDALRAAGPKVFVGFSDLTVLARGHRHPPGTGHPARADGGRHRLPQERAGPGAPAGHPVRPRDGPAPSPPAARPWCPAAPAAPPSAAASACSPRNSAPRTPGPPPAADCSAWRTWARRRYRLDRYLTQLLRAGWLDGVRGCCSAPGRTAPTTPRCAPAGRPARRTRGAGRGERRLRPRRGALTIPVRGRGRAGRGGGHAHAGRAGAALTP